MSRFVVRQPLTGVTQWLHHLTVDYLESMRSYCKQNGYSIQKLFEEDDEEKLGFVPEYVFLYVIQKKFNGQKDFSMEQVWVISTFLKVPDGTIWYMRLHNLMKSDDKIFDLIQKTSSKVIFPSPAVSAPGLSFGSGSSPCGNQSSTCSSGTSATGIIDALKDIISKYPGAASTSNGSTFGSPFGSSFFGSSGGGSVFSPFGGSIPGSGSPNTVANLSTSGVGATSTATYSVGFGSGGSTPVVGTSADFKGSSSGTTGVVEDVVGGGATTKAGGVQTNDEGSEGLVKKEPEPNS